MCVLKGCGRISYKIGMAAEKSQTPECDLGNPFNSVLDGGAIT